MLKWDSVAGAEKYEIYRRMYGSEAGDEAEWKQVKTTKGTTLIDDTVTPGVKYGYRAKSVADDGGKSAYSEVAKATAKVPTVPFTSVSSERTGEVTVTLRAVDGVSKYNIYRRPYDKSKKDWGEWESIATVTELTYTDTGLESGARYSYRATSVGSDGTEMGPSNAPSVTVK